MASGNHIPKRRSFPQSSSSFGYQNGTFSRPVSYSQGVKTPSHVSAAISSEMVEQKMKDLTLEVEKELNSPGGSEPYFGRCAKCNQGVYGHSTACQAMGKIYHNTCFVCGCCSRTLRGKAFYNVNGKIFCEEDYLYSGFQQSAKKCHACGHPIMEMILHALGNPYHPGCFRCCVCNKGLDGVPFTIDIENKIYCVEDYNKLQKIYAPKCAKCQLPITSVNGRKETVKVVSMGKDFHVDCFICENCGIQLNDASKPRYFLLNGRLLCHVCRDLPPHHQKTRGHRHSLQNFPTTSQYGNGQSKSTNAGGSPVRVRSLEIDRHPSSPVTQVPRVKSWHPTAQ
ncbi:Wilms tumor protein 1-interacting protein homolog [Styela clava]